MVRFIALSAVLLTGAAPALAQKPNVTVIAEAKAKDPSRKICETFAETGSRLSTKKVCMTAEQWRAQRQDHRDDVERAQKNVGIDNPQ